MRILRLVAIRRWVLPIKKIHVKKKKKKIERKKDKEDKWVLTCGYGWRALVLGGEKTNLKIILN